MYNVRVTIEAYDFGIITIDGETLTSDLKILDGQIIPEWWRIQSHKLQVADIEDILEGRPEVLVVGTGYSGLMAVSREVRSRCLESGIQLVAKPTRQACVAFNETSQSKRTAFAAHLTC